MYTALEDIKIETIDFNWIKETTKISHLKRAIRLIEADGDYFKELKDACYKRIEEIDPSLKRVEINNKPSPELQHQIQFELKEWEKLLEKKEAKKQIFDQNLEDYEKYFDNQTKISEQKAKQRAENERVKGNEALKSKDFDEAITYYGNSLQYDPGMFQSYGNRALAYLKKKQFQKCINDCQNAIRLSPTYTKAYHRKAKALTGLKHRIQAYRVLQQAIKIEPENAELNAELKALREEMSEAEIKQLESSLIPKSQFKKITIEEDSDEQIQEK